MVSDIKNLKQLHVTLSRRMGIDELRSREEPFEKKKCKEIMLPGKYNQMQSQIS